MFMSTSLLKLARILLLAGLLCNLPHPVWAQALAFSPAPVQTDRKPLREALLQLRDSRQVDLIFEESLLENKFTDDSAVDLGTPVDKQLARLVEPFGLQVKKLKKNTYVITVGKENTGNRKKRAAVPQEAASANTAPPQANAKQQPDAVDLAANAITVTGIVTDENASALPGVTVSLKGQPRGTVTDAEGRYTISVPDGEAVLVFSFIGYVTEEIAVNNRTVIDVTLLPSIQTLGETVVVGYGTQRRTDLSTSVATVEARDLGRQTVAGFDQALQGQAAGVQVTAPSGAPGAGINIRIRGNNSVSLTNSPLYVIDGVPVLPTYDQELALNNQRPNPLNTLNPADIESIDILKDGASAAIYGSRASNGVVVITTKRGKTGKPQVAFSAYAGVQQLRKKIDLLNGREFATLFNEARANGGLSPVYNPDTVRTNTDWQDLIYRPAPIRNYQLSVRGGSQQTKYYVSGSYFDQQGIILNSGFKRFAFKLNLDQEISKKLRVGTSLNLSRGDNNNSVRSEQALNNSGVVLGALTQIPTMPVFQPDGRYALNPFSQTDNPYSNLVETRNRAIIHQVIANMYGEFDILENLTFRTNAAIDYRSQIENRFVTREYAGTINSPSASRGSGATGTNQETIWLWENTLTYRPQLGEGHNLNVLAGYSAQASNRFTSSASAFGYPSNAVPYLFAASQFQRPSSFEDQWGLASYFLRTTYSFSDRYFLTASLRADGSSRFSAGNRFGYFPALSAAWRISEAAFFPKTNLLSDLKLRVSYGANGNQNIGVNDRFSTFGTGYNYTGVGGVVGGIAPDRIGNNRLRWETTDQFNAGVDLGLLNNRITFVADVYLKRTRDLLNNVPLAFNTGAQNTTVTQNIGAVENRGFELGVNSTNVDAQNSFRWTTQLNLSFNQNKVIDIGTQTNDENQVVPKRIIGDYSITERGQPLGAFYGFVTQGIFQNEQEIANAPRQDNARPGDIRFADLNGDNIINGDDRRVIGNPNPLFFGGLTNNFSYKGFELSLFFQGSFGNDIYHANRQLTEGMMALPLSGTRNTLNRWRTPGQPTDVPRAVFGDPNNNNRFSDRFVEDGTYVRLKNLTLAYNFPAQWLSRAKIASLRLYVTGQNLLTFTNYSGYDPEVSADPFSATAFGRDFGVYPQARIYTAGINVEF